MPPDSTTPPDEPDRPPEEPRPLVCPNCGRSVPISNNSGRTRSIEEINRLVLEGELSLDYTDGNAYPGDFP